MVFSEIQNNHKRSRAFIRKRGVVGKGYFRPKINRGIKGREW